jgi:uncharacterized membrane protein YqhA
MNKINYRWHRTFGRWTIIAGILSLVIAYLIYKFITIKFIYEAYPNLVGLGIITIFAGIIFILSGKKVPIQPLRKTR